MLVVVVTKSSKRVTSVLVCSFEKVPLFRELFVKRDGGDFNSSSRVNLFLILVVRIIIPR